MKAKNSRAARLGRRAIQEKAAGAALSRPFFGAEGACRLEAGATRNRSGFGVVGVGFYFFDLVGVAFAVGGD
jgi:hypothetical protein